MTISTEEKHAETIALLDEVLSYLERLPRVPVTVEFVSRIREQMKEPLCEKASSMLFQRGGEAYDSVGRKVVTATVRGDVLQLHVPTPFSPGLCNPEGVLIQLSPLEPVTKREY